MRRTPLLTAIALLVTVMVVGLANIGGGQAAPYGEPVSVTIPGSLVRAQIGSTVSLGTFSIPVGECTGSLTVRNGPSRHQGNNLTVESNGTSITAFNVETTSGKVTVGEGTLISDGTLEAFVYIGNTDAYDNGAVDENGVPFPPGTGTYSGTGDSIELECTPPPTTAPPPPVTTAPPPTSSPPSSTTTTTVTNSTTTTTTTISSTSVPPSSGSSTTSTTVALTLPPTR